MFLRLVALVYTDRMFLRLVALVCTHQMFLWLVTLVCTHRRFLWLVALVCGARRLESGAPAGRGDPPPGTRVSARPPGSPPVPPAQTSSDFRRTLKTHRKYDIGSILVDYNYVTDGLHLCSVCGHDLGSNWPCE